MRSRKTHKTNVYQPRPARPKGITIDDFRIRWYDAVEIGIQVRMFKKRLLRKSSTITLLEPPWIVWWQQAPYKPLVTVHQSTRRQHRRKISRKHKISHVLVLGYEWKLTTLTFIPLNTTCNSQSLCSRQCVPMGFNPVLKRRTRFH
jgi:hypothetical protein